jgi:hypothetical protein
MWLLPVRIPFYCTGWLHGGCGDHPLRAPYCGEHAFEVWESEGYAQSMLKMPLR